VVTGVQTCALPISGNYSVTADNNGCRVESDAFQVSSQGVPEKPILYAQGPNVWYLVCSNYTASSYKWYYNGNLIDGALKYYYVARQNLGTYFVRIGNANGCYTSSDTLQIPTNKTSNSIKKLELKDPFADIKIYPNPSPGVFNIEMDNDLTGELNINIITQAGNSVLKIRFEKISEHFSSQIDLSGQIKGIYLINIILDPYSTTRQIIIK
jgi:hypothetical protein